MDKFKLVSPYKATGDQPEAIDALAPYKESKYQDWWPLWYYLGVARAQLDENEEAAEDFRHVLQLSPSNLETMEELVRVYEKLGRTDLVEKYEKKQQEAAQAAKEPAAPEEPEAPAQPPVTEEAHEAPVAEESAPNPEETEYL